MMNNSVKEQVGRDILCKSHSARSDRELYRICPSKLSKRELEDLYFVLLENNFDLKRTVNGQNEKIKVLSTKVQRMTATQRSTLNKEQNCCASTKAVVCEQKETIAELKKANEQMSERIRLLNMRLCSAKQFLKRSPTQHTSKCTRCCTTTPGASVKNCSMSALNTKKSDGNLATTAISSQHLNKEVLTTRTVETETNEQEKESSDKLCDENKCRTLMEELKQKIVNLQEELSNTHEEYSTRISRLEREVSEMHSENMRVMCERAASEHALQQRDKRVDELANKLRDTEVHCNDLAMQLSIEKQKVAELETSVKVANMSNQVSKTIEDHFTSLHDTSCKKSLSNVCAFEPNCSPCLNCEESSPRLEVPSPDKRLNITATAAETSAELDEHKLSKSDDSGYIDTNKSQDFDVNKGINKEDQNLINKIAELQAQLDFMKISSANDSKENNANLTDHDVVQRKDSNRSIHVSTKDVLANKDAVEIIDSETKESVNKEKKKRENNIDTSTPYKDGQNIKETCTQPCEVETNQAKNSWGDYTDIATTSKDLTKNTNVDKSADGSGAPNIKTDNHNSFQIPGPIPVRKTSYSKESKRTNVRSLSTAEKYKKHKDEKKINKKYEADENSLRGKCKIAIEENKHNKKVFDTNNTQRLKDNSNSDDENKDTADSNFDLKKKKLVSLEDQKVEKKAKKVSIPNIDFVTAGNMSEDSVKINDRIIENSNKDDETKQGNLNSTINDVKENRVKVNAEKNINFSEPETQSEERDDNTFVVTQPAQSPVQSPRRDSLTQTGPRTYSIQGSCCRRPRVNSPENTDCEISSLTDLPSERDDKNRRDALSPGEDKATSTYSDTYTTSSTVDYGTLSEGELPAVGRARKLSTGEKPTSDAQVTRTLSSMKMEAALQAVSEELARCKQLLQSHRPRESSRAEYRDASAATDACAGAGADAGGFALKRAAAAPSIGDVFAPRCIFTLHIGTIVLSDEAVMNSRDISLVLRWKFYDQNVTMVRMRAGRVVLFDFSTEYDVKITDDFLNYLKHEEMQITIGELDKQDEPFASCFLPLRDALLHTNRRADMSLALVTGPQLRQERAVRDALDAGDEMGVLDLWCMLRAEPRQLPAINRAIAGTSSSTLKNNASNNNLRHNSRVMEQVTDEPSNDYRLSHDLDLRSMTSTRWSNVEQKFFQPVQTSQDTEASQYTQMNQPTSQIFDELNARPGDSKYRIAPYKRRSSQAQKFIPSTDSPKGQVGFEDAGNWQQSPRNLSSGFIINEVPSNIKSAEEMQKALERNIDNNDSRAVSRLSKMDDNVSQAHSSIGSMKSLSFKHQLQHFKWNNYDATKDKPDSLQDLLKKERRLSYKVTPRLDLPQKKLEESDQSDMSKKYDNISKIIDSNKAVELSKKSVTISPKYRDTAAEEPQKDMNSDEDRGHNQSITITVLWLALNEECEAMVNPNVQRLYVAYTFLGRNGAELETPVSLPKPKHYIDKCFFNFKKTFHLHDCDLPLLGHMARCRTTSTSNNPKNCIVFTVVSEPLEDPLGLDSCEDIGHAYLYLGDVLAYSAQSSCYTEVVPVEAAGGGAVCGVLAVRVDGLAVLRRCLALSYSQRDLPPAE